MTRRVLDTSVLIRYWNQRRTRVAGASIADSETWAGNLIDLYRTRAILSPIYLEFICGLNRRPELEAGKRFLEQFEVIDGWRIQPEDLQEAKRIAQRVPRTGKPRQLGDCLIRAMATRLRHDVVSVDQSFPAA